MEQIKINVKKEIKKLDESLVMLKTGIESTKLTKKDKEEIILDLEEMIALLESTKK